jgi:hypothetical protein
MCLVRIKHVYLSKQKLKIIIMKEFNLSDLEWDFSDSESVSLEIGKYVLNISREELESFIESWDENFEDDE